MSWNILLHGANARISSDAYSSVPLVSVAALQSYALVTVPVVMVRPYALNEGETEDGVGSVIVETRRQRDSYNIDVETFNFNDSSDTALYDSIKSILAMRYLYLSNVDYPKALNCTNGVTDVVRAGYETSEEAPNYKLTIELHKRKANP